MRTTSTYVKFIGDGHEIIVVRNQNKPVTPQEKAWVGSFINYDVYVDGMRSNQRSIVVHYVDFVKAKGAFGCDPKNLFSTPPKDPPGRA